MSYSHDWSRALREWLERQGVQAEVVEAYYQPVTDVYNVRVLAEDHRWPPLRDAIGRFGEVFERALGLRRPRFEVALFSRAMACAPEASEQALLSHARHSDHLAALVRANPAARLYAMANPAAWEGVL